MRAVERGVMVDEQILRGAGVRVVDYECCGCGRSFLGLEMVPVPTQIKP